MPHNLGDHPWIGGVVMAVMISILRIVYDQQETRMSRIVLESLICGALTVTVGSLLEALGYGQDWYLFCGGAIGFMGSQSVRAFANKVIDKQND